jgi:hypothetical protein
VKVQIHGLRGGMHVPFAKGHGSPHDDPPANEASAMCNPECDDDANTSTILNSSSTSNAPLTLGRDISDMKSGANMASVLLPTPQISGATASIAEPMAAVCKVKIITEMRQVVARSLQSVTPSKSQLLMVWMDHTLETTEELHTHEDQGEHAFNHIQRPYH